VQLLELQLEGVLVAGLLGEHGCVWVGSKGGLGLIVLEKNWVMKMFWLFKLFACLFNRYI